jgi:hypothetical protein
MYNYLSYIYEAVSRSGKGETINRIIIDKQMVAIVILFVVLYHDLSGGLRRTANNFNCDTRSQGKDSNPGLSEYKPEFPHQYTTLWR